MVVRVAGEDYRLGAGEPHETLIPRGTTVFALTWSAMFDPRVLEAPEAFRPGRPDYHYLHFATGFHACFGRYVSRVQIPQILKPLLRLKGLRPAGAPEYDGTFPDGLMVAADV
jgi:cytochrome P450